MEAKIPLYHKVYNYLLEKIKNDYQPGDLLPTQFEIADETETSLITVKRAIKELEAAGHLASKPGKGTIVKKPKVVDNHVGVSSWTDSIAGQGSTPSTAWTKVEQKEPTSSVVNSLQLKNDDKTVLIERLRLIDNKPICLMTNELPLRLVPDIGKKTELNESLYAFLKDQYNLIGVAADEEVYARPASAYEIDILQLKTPIVLVIERASFLMNNVPFELSRIIASADSYVYRSRQINKTVDHDVLTDLLTSTTDNK